MEKKIIDGQNIAKKIREKIREEIANEELFVDRKPCLAVVIAGNDPASKIYVRGKEKACSECGIRSVIYELGEDVEENKVIETVMALNNDSEVDGILLQLPLPKHLDRNKIINLISPDKDVDCFHPMNIGKMFINEEKHLLLPCTPKGCMILLKSVCSDISGKKAVIVGRSNIVGKPLAQMLLNENCTIEILHSKTKNLEEEIKTADIVVMALGKEKFLKAYMIKEGAIVIDVGINRSDDGKIYGDADFEDVVGKCSFITPVPKGVGPMTIACLLENLMFLYRKSR